MNQLALHDVISTATVSPQPNVAEWAVPPAQTVVAPGKMSKWKFWGVLLAPALAMGWATTGAARDCHVKPIPLVLGQDTQVTAAVPRGVSCSMRVRPGNAMVEDLRIDAPPHHGELAPRGRTGVYYRPDRKFKGEDSFAFALRGGSSAARATSVVRVLVTVK
jgi:hypothetical protein